MKLIGYVKRPMGYQVFQSGTWKFSFDNHTVISVKEELLNFYEGRFFAFVTGWRVWERMLVISV